MPDVTFGSTPQSTPANPAAAEGDGATKPGVLPKTGSPATNSVRRSALRRGGPVATAAEASAARTAAASRAPAARAAYQPTAVAAPEPPAAPKVPKKQAPVKGEMPRGNAETISRMERLLADFPVRRKAMFGTVSWFLEANGQMFTTVWDHAVSVRVGVEEAKRLIAAREARIFEPVEGRPMREYVLVPASTLRDAQLREWVERASEFAAALEPKKPKKPK